MLEVVILLLGLFVGLCLGTAIGSWSTKAREGDRQGHLANSLIKSVVSRMEVGETVSASFWVTKSSDDDDDDDLETSTPHDPEATVPEPEFWRMN